MGRTVAVIGGGYGGSAAASAYLVPLLRARVNADYLGTSLAGARTPEGRVKVTDRASGSSPPRAALPSCPWKRSANTRATT
jgi:hypothetical protein